MVYVYHVLSYLIAFYLTCPFHFLFFWCVFSAPPRVKKLRLFTDSPWIFVTRSSLIRKPCVLRHAHAPGGHSRVRHSINVRRLGIFVHVVLRTDSSTAMGVTSRQGLGKLRHLDARNLWLQQKLRESSRYRAGARHGELVRHVHQATGRSDFWADVRGPALFCGSSG